jgi:hypothetical protein
VADLIGDHTEQHDEIPTRRNNRHKFAFLLDCYWRCDCSLFFWRSHSYKRLGFAHYPLSLLAQVLSERPWAVSFVLIATSVLAVLPFVLKTKNRWLFVFLVAPQQILLLAHFMSAFFAIMSGQYPDGCAPDGGSAFIFVDQV